MRLPISAEEKLAVTLRFLATGESYESLMYQYRIHCTTIGSFIPEVCRAIYQCLKDEYLTIPKTENEWKSLSDATMERWQFPNAFGAMDGKHIGLFHPHDSGSEYYNYKGFYSLVMLALVDFDYRFTFIDVGCQGRISDGGVFRNSSLCKAINTNTLSLPEAQPLPKSDLPEWQDYEDDTPIPFVFVADDAFPLSEHCMKPFPQKGLDDIKRIFNYRLSRFRRISENAFGIWTSRFRIFMSRVNLNPDTAVQVVLASITLHNMLIEKSIDTYTTNYVDEEISGGDIQLGQWRTEANIDFLRSIPVTRQVNRHSRTAEAVRDHLANYFYSPGAVPWQWNVII